MMLDKNKKVVNLGDLSCKDLKKKTVAFKTSMYLEPVDVH